MRVNMTTQTLEITPDIIQKHNLTSGEYEQVKKILGRTPNKLNNARATIEALKKLKA